jgi:hypothetical protein
MGIKHRAYGSKWERIEAPAGLHSGYWNLLCFAPSARPHASR